MQRSLHLEQHISYIHLPMEYYLPTSITSLEGIQSLSKRFKFDRGSLIYLTTKSGLKTLISPLFDKLSVFTSHSYPGLDGTFFLVSPRVRCCSTVLISGLGYNRITFDNSPFRLTRNTPMPGNQYCLP